MALFDVSFIFGFLLGIVLVSILFWGYFIWQKGKMFSSIAALDADKRHLSEMLAKAQSEMSVVSERASQANFLRDELQNVRTLLEEKRHENSELNAKIARLSTENEKSLEFFGQRVNDLMAVHQNMKEAFASISKDTLIKNADLLNTSFKQSMDHFFKISEQDRTQSKENLSNIITPLRESLSAVDKKVGELETSRQGAYAGLREQIEGLLKSQSGLQRETQNLSRALSAPTIRGRWGEMQLRRVVELSGLSSYCDFVEQKTLKDGDDVLRPDMIVTLPQNKKIVIDAKAPLEMLVDKPDGESVDAERGQELALSLKRHLLTLKKRSYHSVIGDSPEFVVMFLPSEAFLHLALVADPMLLDFAAQNEIIIATPITLVALLKAISFGFRQEAIASNVEEVRRLSQQLIDRVEKVSSHFEKLGRSLRSATEAYNQTLSSLDSRVLVTARKIAQIKSMTVENDETLLKSLPTLDILPKEATSRLRGEEESDV